MITNNKKNTRIMAIDYGDARTGVAVSDESATLTGDAWVIHEKRPKVLAKTILDEAKARGVGTIVVGFPKNMDGSVGFRAEASETFANKLRQLMEIETETRSQLQPESDDINIVLWDERLTTMMAGRLLSDVGKRGKKRKSSLDAVAASLILESYLASKSG